MPRGRSNLATVPTIDFGQPSTRLQRLLESTQKREPYELTDTLTVAPPMRNARKRLDELAYSLARTQTLMQDALRRAAEPQPEDDEAAVKAWEAQVTAASEEFRDHSTNLEKDNTEWTRTLLGDAYDSVTAFLGEQEPELYDTVIADIREHFQSPLGEPDTGVCSKCGTVLDEDAAGKDSESAT
jgi:predicted transcriptional regulator